MCMHCVQHKVIITNIMTIVALFVLISKMFQFLWDAAIACNLLWVSFALAIARSTSKRRICPNWCSSFWFSDISSCRRFQRDSGSYWLYIKRFGHGHYYTNIRTLCFVFKKWSHLITLQKYNCPNINKYLNDDNTYCHC